MRCPKCKRKNRRGSNYCAGCGTKLNGNGSASLNRCLNRAFAVIICCALFIAAVCFLNAWLESRRAGQSAAMQTEAPSPVSTFTPVPTVTPVPTATLPPFVKPVITPRPTPTPVITARPATPTPLATPSPVTTPDPVETALVSQEDLEPIDALIDFLLTFDPNSARKAFPPQYILHKVSGYGYAVGIMGGEDAVIRNIGRMIVSGLTVQYGRISGISYELTGRRQLTPFELSVVKSEISAYGMSETPTEARLLDLRIILVSSSGRHVLSVCPRVLNIGGTWYIHPDDIDKMT